ncbi:unnamed protein product [Orchesella dallaii]|uniref:Major facilitator superfamily (MFS) profile domain-containing protein n=1 Tax=Orchesella dallaii TaxID=48710 RepID=A0ABP1RH65_9HEXA
MSEHDSSSVGFETAFKLVGGSGRFQMLAMVISSLQLLLMTWNHMGYIFIGAVPKHWCHIPELVNSGWSEEQVKNISIPQIHLIPGSSNGDVKYEQCLFYNLNFSQILLQSGGNFESAYELAHAQKNNEQGDFTSSSSSSLSVTKCQKWDYDKSMYTSTIVSQFDLVCDQRYKVATGQASYMIGAFVGTLFFGPLNDRILGRRNSTLVSIVLSLTGNFLVVFATSYVMFIATRTLVALGTAGAMQAMGIWFLEHCDTKSRAKLYLISGMFFGVGYAIMPIYAFYLRDWSSLQLAFSVTSLPLLSFFWLLPESPRWLASKGRDEEAIKALERMARINGKPKPSRALLLKAVQHCHQDPLDHQDESGSMMMPPISPEQNGNENEKDEASQVKTNTRKKSEPIFSQLLGLFTNFKSLLSTKELRKISFTVWALFMAVAFVYYGFAFSTNLTTNPYLLVSVGALMEIPASVLPIPFLSKWGRRPTTVACYCITGLAALSIAITPSEHETARTVLSMIGKLFVASAFTVLYLVVSEVYPTVARSTGQGAGTLMGRVGSIAAPFVADLLTTAYPDLPLVIFGIVALLAAGIALFIPEMKGVDMKDQVYEYEETA